MSIAFEKSEHKKPSLHHHRHLLACPTLFQIDANVGEGYDICSVVNVFQNALPSNDNHP